MPSGAKKRKAAKKKKVNQTTTTTSTSTLSLGEQDLRPIDEKESNGSNVNSPASQDHDIQQHPFAEQQDDVEVEKREDPSSVRSIATESLQGSAAREGEAAVQIDSNLKSEEDFESKNVIIIEWEKELRDGSSSRSSSSSSSDNESRVLDKKIVAVETAPPVDSAKLVESLPEAVTQVNDSVVKETDSIVESREVSLSEQVVNVNKKVSVDSSMDSGEVIESGSKEKRENKLPSLDEKIGSQEEEDAIVSTSNEYPASSSLDANGSESAVQVDEERSLLSVNASKVGTNNGKEHVKYSEATDCSIEQPLIASAPRAVEKTSWKGCCGLFELFTGSSR